MRPLAVIALSIAGICSGTISLPAKVALLGPFGDHMVLQEGVKIPFWGTADPGESVSVREGNENGLAVADAAGKWRVDLAPLQASTTPITVTVTGSSNTITLTDVLVGEVWLCSGQSNIAFNLAGGKYGLGGVVDAANVVAQANDPLLRFFRVASKTALDPVETLISAPAYGAGDWEPCTPDTAARFSAVAYFFGRELRNHLNKPIGLISSSYGGTQAQAWMSLAGLKKEPALQHYVDDEEAIRANLAQATQEYASAMASYQNELTDWRQNVQAPYQQAYAAWLDAARQAKTSHQPVPAMPKLSSPAPAAPRPPDGGTTTPTVLYNGMIAPLVPYAIRGVIWYQGESNAPHAQEYATLFPALIADWRRNWGEGDFPFLYVQLAGYKDTPIQNWPYIREAQLKALALPVTGMASAIDIGTPDYIHPPDKEDVGRRLALVARRAAYGENVVASGPLYDSMKIEGNAIRISFREKGSGLAIAQAPWTPPGHAPLPSDKLLGFTIAGDDQKWVPANAAIVDDAVVVSSPAVLKPVAVRYAWANAPTGNLYNKEGLPASSFRTDTWSDPVAEGQSQASDSAQKH